MIWNARPPPADVARRPVSAGTRLRPPPAGVARRPDPSPDEDREEDEQGQWENVEDVKKLEDDEMDLEGEEEEETPLQGRRCPPGPPSADAKSRPSPGPPPAAPGAISTSEPPSTHAHAAWASSRHSHV